MILSRRALLASAACALLGCQAAPGLRPVRFDSEFPPGEVAPALSPSLWPRERSAQRRATLVSDPTARERGDIVTVLVDESQSATSSAETSIEQTTESKAGLEVEGFPHAFRSMGGPPSGSVESSRAFDGEGSYRRSGSLRARVTAVVVDVLPNGYLVVEGAREVRVDDETRLLEVRGIVRPADLTASNTVLSEQLAEARISYEGDGPLTRSSSRGILGTIVDFLWHHLWPF
ncbi:MAG: flagellar basal body L-ring protein FlgH [Planctomycetota bacterium]|nr:MAG: flagellar basal body L-ring protein FlgH [Planctomycetota bacterium]